MKLLWPVARCLMWAGLAATIFLFFFQSRLMYYLRPYDQGAFHDFEHRGGSRIEVQTSQGKQVAFYLPPRHGSGVMPAFVWLVFGGNGSLALDYLDEPQNWDDRFGYLFVDYPGYGLCEGQPNPDRIRESIIKFAAALQEQLHWSKAELSARAGVFGHSLGCAAALIAAEEIGATRGVLCAPFTKMTDMARLTVGWPLCCLNRHRFDNTARLAVLTAKGFQTSVFHGTADEVIPVTMSRMLAASFPKSVRLTEVPDCHHNEIVTTAAKEIGKAMIRLSGLLTH